MKDNDVCNKIISALIIIGFFIIAYKASYTNKTYFYLIMLSICILIMGNIYLYFLKKRHNEKKSKKMLI